MAVFCDSPPLLQLMDLHTTSKFKKMVEAGQVFGTEKTENGQNIFSQVTADGDKLYLHAMKSQLPPAGSFTFRVGVNVSPWYSYLRKLLHAKQLNELKLLMQGLPKLYTIPKVRKPSIF